MSKLKLSKSQYLKGIQCPLRLWYYTHCKDLIPPIDPATQAIFDQGHEVGLIAQKLCPGGVSVTTDFTKIPEAKLETDKAISDGAKAIYEATAINELGIYSRIDILVRSKKNKNTWDLVEVKSSTEVKDYHIDDCAVQRYVFESAGYKIDKSLLCLVDRDYIRKGDIDPDKLLIYADITEEVQQKMIGLEDKALDLIKIKNKKKEPHCSIGDHCTAPFECEFKEHCWKHIPDFSIYNVMTKSKKRAALVEQGIIEIKDIPREKVSVSKLIDIESFLSNKPFFNKKKIKDWLGQLSYPLYFLDYETINPAIPLYDLMSPYKQYPFQFSVHIQKKKGAKVTHLEFLNTEQRDFREDFIKALIEGCGDEGSIIIYNMSFEKQVNNRLAEDFPKYRKELEKINERMVDLLIPFRSRYIYSPDQNGSAGLKSTFPAFVGDLYNKLEIKDGATAQKQYMEFLQDKIDPADQSKIFEDLLDYCELDTFAMVKLLEVLYQHQK